MYWKKSSAKHGCEELKEVSWLEPGQVLLRKKVKENWTEKHRTVARMDAKETIRCGLVRYQSMSSLPEGGRHRKAQALPLPREWYEVRREIPEPFRIWEQKAGTSKKEWKWRRGIVEHPLSESQWNRGHFSMRKWESEKHKTWGMRAEGFKGHVATDGSLLGNAGMWGACGWAVAQLDCEAIAWDVWLNGGSIRGSAHHQEGGVDSLLVPPRVLWMGYERVRERVSSQELAMQTCGSKFGKNYTSW